MLQGLFRPRPARAAGERLYAAAVDQARRPEFYTAMGVADAIDARFELYTLHVVLLLERLKGGGEQAAETAQALFDVYVKALDGALREMGVGDLTVPKKMRKLGESFYGRVKVYDEAFAAEDEAALETALARNVYGEAGGAERAEPLAAYVRRTRAALAEASVETLFEGRAPWPDPLA